MKFKTLVLSIAVLLMPFVSYAEESNLQILDSMQSANLEMMDLSAKQATRGNNFWGNNAIKRAISFCNNIGSYCVVAPHSGYLYAQTWRLDLMGNVLIKNY